MRSLAIVNLRMKRLFRSSLLAFLVLGWASSSLAAIFDVNSLGDDIDINVGDGACTTGNTVDDPDLGLVAECTLRAAIMEANADFGRDRIEFKSSLIYHIFTNVAVFAPTSTLPFITFPVDIDGRTAPGHVAGGNPKILIQEQGHGLSTGLTLSFGAADSSVLGIGFQGFPTALTLNGTDGAWIDECSFGYFVTRVLDESVDPNIYGINVTFNAINTKVGKKRVGNNFVGYGNTISGNETGIYVAGENTSMVGNRIGTDRTGNRIRTQTVPFVQDLGNTYAGIHVENGSGLEIGKVFLVASGGFPMIFEFVSEGNVISGNEVGIKITDSFGAGTASMVIHSNMIGTDIDGETALGNITAGIDASDADTDLVIGSSASPNIIGANGTHGIDIGGGGLALVRIDGNRIGVGADGSTDLGNVEHGIRAEGGDPLEILSNVVGYNGEDGIHLPDPGSFGSLGSVLVENNWVRSQPELRARRKHGLGNRDRLGRGRRPRQYGRWQQRGHSAQGG